MQAQQISDIKEESLQKRRQKKPNGLLNASSLFVPWLHKKLARRSDANGVGISTVSKDKRKIVLDH